jgi:hypothetical protein
LKSESEGKSWIKELYDRSQLKNSVKKSQLTKPFKKYEDVFNAHEFDPGKNSRTHHTIPLKTSTSINPRPYVRFTHRTTPHSTTKLSPFLLLYGREANHPGDTMFPEPPIQYMEESTYADILPRFLNKAWQIAKDNIQEAQEQYKSRYDRNATPHPFQIGEQLLIHTPQPRKGLSPKLQKLWSGPFTILDVTPQNVLVSPTRMNRRTPQWIHVNRCKPAPIDFELATPNKKIGEDSSNEVPNDETIVEEATTPTSEVIETNHEQADKEEIQSEAEPPNVPPPLYFSLRSRQIPKIVALLTVIALCLVSTNDTKIAIKPELLIVDLNSPAQLKCTIDIVGDDTIEWHHQLMGSGFIYEDDSGLKESRLVIPQVGDALQGNYTCIHKVKGHIVASITSTVLLTIWPNECYCKHDRTSDYHSEITLNCEIGASRMANWPLFQLNSKPLSWEQPNEFFTFSGDKVFTAILDFPHLGLLTIWKRLTPVKQNLSHLHWINVSFVPPYVLSNVSIPIIDERKFVEIPVDLFKEFELFRLSTSLRIRVTRSSLNILSLKTPGCSQNFFIRPPPANIHPCNTTNLVTNLTTRIRISSYLIAIYLMVMMIRLA